MGWLSSPPHQGGLPGAGWHHWGRDGSRRWGWRRGFCLCFSLRRATQAALKARREVWYIHTGKNEEQDPNRWKCKAQE